MQSVPEAVVFAVFWSQGHPVSLARARSNKGWLVVEKGFPFAPLNKTDRKTRQYKWKWACPTNSHWYFGCGYRFNQTRNPMQPQGPTTQTSPEINIKVIYEILRCASHVLLVFGQRDVSFLCFWMGGCLNTKFEGQVDLARTCYLFELQKYENNYAKQKTGENCIRNRFCYSVSTHLNLQRLL